MENFIKKDRGIPTNEIAEKLNTSYPSFNVSEQTVIRTLTELGWQCIRPKSVPPLNPARRERHIEWAKNHLHQK